MTNCKTCLFNKTDPAQECSVCDICTNNRAYSNHYKPDANLLEQIRIRKAKFVAELSDGLDEN